MRNILTSKIWQLFLAIAFLTMQTASAHIHLSSTHNHDGVDHSHTQVAHSHNIASHHVDAFAQNQDSHSNQVVELSQDGIVKYAKWLSDLESQGVLLTSFSCCELKIVTQSYFDKPFRYRSFRFRSNVQARAPPILFPSHV
tara:strand:- start:44 stop:466 length:423 start_codon:yes stop_codon:yes gene_type:complete